MPITFLDEEEDIETIVPPTKRKITFLDEEDGEFTQTAPSITPYQYDKSRFRPKAKTPEEKEIGTLEGITNAAKNAFDSSRQAMDVIGGVTPEEAKNISKIEYDKQSRKLAQGYDEYQKAEGMDAVWAFAKNPIEVTSNIIAEGLAGSLPALGAGLAAGGAGALIGAPTGIGAPIGFTAGQIAGTFAGSLATEYGGKILEEMQNEGMDIQDPESIQKFFSNQTLVDAAKDKALKRGVPIAAFDAISAGIGGKLGRVIGKQFVTKTGEAAAELGVQAGLGGAGAIVGPLAAGEAPEGKEVFGEIIGEAGPGAAEIITGRMADRAARVKAEEDAKIKAAAELSTNLEENSAPLTAAAVKSTTATTIEQDKLAAQLEEQLDAEELVAVKEPTAAPPTAIPTKDDYVARYSAIAQVAPEELTRAEQSFTNELATADTEEKRTNAQNALDAIKEVKATRVAAPEVKPTKAGKLPTDVLPVETPGATYGREEGIYDVFAGVRRKPLEPTQPAAEAAQPTPTYATEEIIQPEGVRQEPQDGTQVRPTAEAIVSDSLQPPARGEEEGQVIFGLRSVADNTATREQISALSEAGLVDIVKGKPVINEDGAAILARTEAPAIVEQELVTTPALEEAVTPAPIAEAPVAAPVEQVVTPPVGVAPAPAIEEEPMSVSDEKEFAELNDLMERKGQAENKVRGVKFTKQDQSRYQNLVTKFRDRLIETTDPKNDPVVGTDINGTPIQQSNKGTFYTFENGRVRTGPAFSEATPAPTIAEAAPVAPITPAPVTEQTTPAEALAPEVAPIPAVSETITEPAEAAVPAQPAGIAVGNRIKLGKSPQTYTIEEVIPQTANDKKFGEQYYNVKNEKTGETQVVEKNDMKPVGARKRRMAGKRSSIWEYPEQDIPSAATSINASKLPETFKRVEFKSGTINADIGGGRFDNATEALASRGVENVIYDPFNRSIEWNKNSASRISGGKADTATVNSVLNVIKEPKNRERVIMQAADAVKKDGKAYFLIYEGDASGNSRITKQKDGVALSWQEHRKAETYIPEINKFFGKVEKSGNLLIASDPINSQEIRRMAAKPTPLPDNERYGQVKLNRRVQSYFGGKIPDRVYVVDDAVDPEYEYKAAYYPDEGILILNNAFIRKNENIGDIIAHELGHYAFGDAKFKAAFDEFYNSLTPEEKADIDQLMGDSYNNETEESQMEERKVIAFTSFTIATPQRRSLWNAVLDAMKAFLNRVFGKNFKMSDPTRTALAMLATAKRRFAAGEEIVREDIQARKMAAQTQDARFAELEARARAGDKEAEAEAQRMVDERAISQGIEITYPLFRGVRRNPKNGVMYTQGERATLSFTDVPEVAKLYTHNQEFGGITPSPYGSVKKVYLNIKNPLDIRDEGTKVNLGDFIDKYFNWDWKSEDYITEDNVFSGDDLVRLLVRMGKLQSKTEFESDIQSSDPEGIFRHRDFNEVANSVREILDTSESESEAAEQIENILSSIDLDTYALADNKWVIKHLKDQGYDGLIHKDTIEAGKEFFQEESVAGKPIEEIKGINAEDDYSHDTWRPFNKEQIKLSDPFTYDDAGALIPLSERFQPTSPDIRRMAVEAEPRREQVAGRTDRGTDIITTPVGIIKQTNEVLRTKFFDGTTVSDEATKKAWEYIERSLDIESGVANELAGQINDAVDAATNSKARMGASLFHAYLANYAAKLAAQGDSSMSSYLIRRINRMPLDNRAGGMSDYARGLRGAREYEIDGYKALEVEMEGKIDRTAATLFGKTNPSKEQVKATEEAIKESDSVELGTAEEVATEIGKVEKRTGKNVVKKLEEKIILSKASKQAEAIIEQIANIQSDTPSFTKRQENEVRNIVQQDLKQTPDAGRKETWTSQLMAKLISAGVSESRAERISKLVWKQHENKAIEAEIKAGKFAAEKGSLKVIIQRIKDTPLEKQQEAGWRESVIKDYLISAGLDSKAAETAAKLYDSVISERLAEAKQKAFEDTLKRSAPWKDYQARNSRLAKDALDKIRVAIRTGVLDPEQTTEDIIAKENGWTGFTKEQYQRIVQLDSIINNPDNDDVSRREAMAQLNQIIVDAKLPVRFKDALGAYYVGNALMGIPTGLVNLVSPAGFAIRNMLTDIGRYAFTDPARIPLAFESFLDSMRSWYNQTSYAFKNQIYLNDVVEYLQGQNVLRELFDKGKKQWANGEYAAGFVNMAVGMTQITGRVLSALDQGAIAMMENQNISRYAMEALANTKGKVPKDKLKEFANMVLHTKRKVITESVASGMSRDRAGVLADLAVKSEIIAALSTTDTGPRAVLDAAINDALLSVGRNKAITINGIKKERKNLRDAGILSSWPIGILEGISEYAGREGSGMQIFAKMLYGFALVPARVFHNVAWFSPYGFIRLGVDKIARNKGWESRYAMSLQTEAQYKQRFIEAIAGSIAMIGLMALRSGSSDDDDDKLFKIVITGNGPSAATDKQYHDTWNKIYSPYTFHIIIKGQPPIKINIGRGGEALFFPILMAGAMDDWEIKKKQNDTKKSPEDLNMAASVLGSAFFALAQRGPYAAFGKSLFDGSKQGRITEELASQAGYFGKTFIPVLGTSVARNITDFINDPVDRSSIEGAIYANTPIVGPWMGAKALNALGQPIRADDWGDKLYKLGVPVVFSFPKDTPMNELNELILKQGSGPTFPTRTNAQKRFGDILTDKEFETYVREYGKVMSDRMFKNRTKLARMKPSDYDDELEKYARGYSTGDFKVKGASDAAVQAVKRMRQ